MSQIVNLAKLVIEQIQWFRHDFHSKWMLLQTHAMQTYFDAPCITTLTSNLVIFFPFLSFELLTYSWTNVLNRVFVSVLVTEQDCSEQCVSVCVCASHTFLCQHRPSTCNVYFMLCWPLLHVKPQLPSNIHSAEAHLHIKGPCTAKCSLSKYLSFSVLLSLLPYVSHFSLAFQFPCPGQEQKTRTTTRLFYYHHHTHQEHWPGSHYHMQPSSITTPATSHPPIDRGRRKEGRREKPGRHDPH